MKRNGPARKVNERSVTILRAAWSLAALIAGRFFTPWSGELAMWAFCTPLTRHRRDDDRFAQATAFTLTGGVRGWVWGQGPPVYLVHGWAGSTSQLLAFVPGLVERGYSVVAIDQPAHGHSSGWMTNAADMSNTLHALAARVGKPVAIIAHSLGGVVASHAVRTGLDPRAVVLISTPRKPERFFRRMLKLGRYRRPDAVVRAAERVLGASFSDFIVGPSLRDTPTLLIHDTDDREVPIANQHEIRAALLKPRTLQTHGLGHNWILQDAGVVRAATAFIGETLGHPAHYAPVRPVETSDWSAPLITTDELWLDLSYGRE